MKIGVSLFPGRYPIDAAVMAQKAEALGFDSFWVGEHPVMPVQSTSSAPGASGGSIPDFYSRLVDPFVALARASAVTTTLKLGTGVTLVPERNPLLLAKEVATLDYFSRRRCNSGNSKQRCRSPLRPSVRDALMQLDSRNLAGVPRPAFRDGGLPTAFVGSPETIVKQVQQCREEVGAGVIDLAFQSAATDDQEGVLHALELFGKEVLPRIREI